MTEPLYSIGTWDSELQAYSPHKDLPAFNLTRKQLVEVMRALRKDGYRCHRYRWRNEAGELTSESWDNDTSVLIERTDGKDPELIQEDWER